MKTLYAGPWVGEFGWELMSWNPLVRKKAQDYDRVVVEGPPTSRYLYEFANEYIDNPTVPHTSDGYLGKTKNPASTLEDCEVFAPNWPAHGAPEMKGFLQPFVPYADREYRCLATNPIHIADVVCAFRPPKKLRDKTLVGREYPLDMCAELVSKLCERGITVACIGDRNNYQISGSGDVRGRDLELQCAVISAAKVAVGPSSGPMHLASLCKIPHVTWFNTRNNSSSQARYKEHWNPFKTPHTYLTQSVPTPEEIVSAVEPYLV